MSHYTISKNQNLTLKTIDYKLQSLKRSRIITIHTLLFPISFKAERDSLFWDLIFPQFWENVGKM